MALAQSYPPAERRGVAGHDFDSPPRAGDGEVPAQVNNLFPPAGSVNFGEGIAFGY